MSARTSALMTQPTADARASLRSLAVELRDAALDVVWRQWRAIGGQTAARGTAKAMVDPEALILMSLVLEEYEPRLTDILHDWIVLNSDMLSVQRVRNLSVPYSDATRERLTWIARVAMVEGKDLRWRGISAPNARSGGRPGKSPRINKQRAVRARLSDPAALVLRLRVGLGVGAKADLLAYLLGIDGEWASVREIATATGYTVAGVRRAAEDMAAARLVQVRSAPPAGYRADTAAWRGLLEFGEEPPRWRSWHERFAFVSAFLAWAIDAQARPLSPYAFAVQARERLQEHRQAFERDLVMIWSEHTPPSDGASFTESAVRNLAHWMKERV